MLRNKQNQLKKNKKASLILSLLIGWWSVVIPNPVRANTDLRLVLNELYPSPPVGQAEWLEIYNVGQIEIEIEGWQIAKLSGGALKSQQQIVDMEGKTVLAPGDFLVMETDRYLTNSGATIYLVDPSGQTVDEVTYASLNQISWARVPDFSGQWQKLEPTPGVTNQLAVAVEEKPNPNNNTVKNTDHIVTNQKQSGDDSDEVKNVTISLSEIMSCPVTGETEWLEIYNQSDFDWQMNSWKVKNQKGTARNIKDLTIKAKSLNVIEFSSGLLVNNGDIVSLETAEGEVLLNGEFGACSEKGNSFVFDGSNWVETTSATKGKENVLTGANGEVVESSGIVFSVENGKVSGGNINNGTDQESNGENNANNITTNESQNNGHTWPQNFSWLAPKLKISVAELEEAVNKSGGGSHDDANKTGGTGNGEVKQTAENKNVIQYQEKEPPWWLLIPAIIIFGSISAVGVWKMWRWQRKNDRKQAKKNKIVAEEEKLVLADLF